MIDMIEQHRTELDSLCRLYNVRTLELFGSASDGTFEPERSDLDFLVDFELMEPGAHAKAYFGLWFALRDLFRREVDLVETPAVTNRCFLQTIHGQRQVLYAA